MVSHGASDTPLFDGLVREVEALRKMSRDMYSLLYCIDQDLNYDQAEITTVCRTYEEYWDA